jgi:hypothetical protein
MTAHTTSARNVRAYLAGTGATGALVAGAIVAFLGVAALFAFNGLPGDSGPSEDDSLFVGAGGGAPAAAATAVGAAPGAVAATPAPIPPAATAAILADIGPAGSDAGGPGLPGDLDSVGTPTGLPAGGGSPPAPASTGPVGGLAGGVDQATNDLGVGGGLGPATEPLTDPLDQTLEQNLPGASGTANQIGQGATGTVNGVLGGGGN